jgi:hypothetical protein
VHDDQRAMPSYSCLLYIGLHTRNGMQGHRIGNQSALLRLAPDGKEAVCASQSAYVSCRLLCVRKNPWSPICERWRAIPSPI